MKTVVFNDGAKVPALGQGTWGLGEGERAWAEEMAALRAGIELGMTLIDTAEMYGEGKAEQLVGAAIEGRRDRVFIVTKVYPHNASRTAMPKACARSLKRLRIEAINLYLLHWKGSVPLEETVETFELLRAEGKIQRWGVSNFDVDDMEDLVAAVHRTASGRLGSIAPTFPCATDQVLYNIEQRGIEFDLLPWCQQRGMPVMAYSPLGHDSRLLKNKVLTEVARHHHTTPVQVTLAWVLRQPGVIAIPKSGDEAHVRENAKAGDIKLTDHDLAAIDRTFLPPRKKQPLAVL